MTSDVFFIFILACVLLALTPGPAMALLVANSASQGVRAGLFTMLGNSLGLGILVVIATLGMNSVMVFMSEWFDFLRWVGAAYLIWLGANGIRNAIGERDADLPVVRRGRHYFRQGLFVALSNPKVLLFLGAFFPQFVNQNTNVTSQLVLLATTFIIVVSLVDMCYVAVASRITAFLTVRRRRFVESISGGLLIVGGLWLATARRS